jgi:hypothetical protein
VRTTDHLVCLAAASILIQGMIAHATTPAGAGGGLAPAERSSAGVHLPTRPAALVFETSEDKQKAGIDYDPASCAVTLRVLVQDPQGALIPHIRRENFVVYENGARQHNADVEVVHGCVSVGLLLQYGGRYHLLNEALATEVPTAAREHWKDAREQ